MVRIWNGFLLHMLKKITEENIINFSLWFLPLPLLPQANRRLHGPCLSSSTKTFVSSIFSAGVSGVAFLPQTSTLTDINDGNFQWCGFFQSLLLIEPVFSMITFSTRLSPLKFEFMIQYAPNGPLSLFLNGPDGPISLYLNRPNRSLSFFLNRPNGPLSIYLKGPNGAIQWDSFLTGPSISFILKWAQWGIIFIHKRA